MKKNNLLRTAQLTSLAAAIAVSMAGVSLAHASSIPNKTLVYCSEGSPAGFDPAQYTTGTDFTANAFTVYNRLVEFERGSTKIEPGLATSWDVSPDGKTYSFTLRHGVSFHDGTSLTSAQALWSWNRYMDPKTGWRCRADFDGRDDTKVVSVAAPAPDRFVMTLAAPDAMFLDTLALPDCGGTGILSPSSVKADGSWDKPVGTGPFMFGEWKRGQSLTLNAFPGYVSPPGDQRDGFLGDKKPLVQALHLLVIPDAATVKAGLISGAIDIASIPESEVAEMRAIPSLAVEIGSDPVRHSIILQTRDPLLKNVKIRQALAAAIDYKQLVDAVTNGLGKVNNSPVYGGSRYFGPVEQQGFTYDPAHARQLLKEAGYKGQPITIVTNKRSNMPSFDTAVIAQQMWQAVGLNVQISTLDWATQLDKYNTGNYMMEATSFSPRFDPALGFEQITGSRDTQPRKIWENPQAIALTAKAMQTTDRAQRQVLFDTLHKMLLEDVPVIFTHNGLSALAHNKRVTGVKPWAGTLLWGVSKH